MVKLVIFCTRAKRVKIQVLYWAVSAPLLVGSNLIVYAVNFSGGLQLAVTPLPLKSTPLLQRNGVPSKPSANTGLIIRFRMHQQSSTNSFVPLNKY